MLAKVRLHNDIKDKKSKTSMDSSKYMVDRKEGKPMSQVRLDKDSELNINIKTYDK